MSADFDQAKAYALHRLERDLPPYLYYHNYRHTAGEVVPAATRLAELTEVTDEPLLLLLTAAYYHDLGFGEDRLEHETISCRIAAETLPDFGYTAEQIAPIQAIIMATRLPQSPANLLESLLADADLGIFGRANFFERNHDLRAELAALGQTFSDKEWALDQLAFIQEHNYFTAVARQLWNAQKEENIRRLKLLLT
jgi:uncharacterized protein